jgi:hypothetical protein
LKCTAIAVKSTKRFGFEAFALILSAVDTDSYRYQIALHFKNAFCYFLASKSK